MIHITEKMNGKMEGMKSINTTPLHNPFCLAMAKTDSVCNKCYSHRMMKMYKTADEKFLINGLLLADQVYRLDELPKINAHTVRFNAHGELLNDVHYENLIGICQNNPRTTFTLWTKRDDIVKRVSMRIGKPRNLILVYSSPKINERAKKLPLYFDKIFTVYSKDYENVTINCEKSCQDCMKCYTLEDETLYINERLK